MTQDNTEHLDTEDQRAFRLKARNWMAGRLPPRVPGEAILDWADPELAAKDRRVQRMLWDGGLAGITLPKAYGGLGLDKRYEDVFHEEAEPYRLPWAFGNAFNVCVPTMVAHGGEALKTRYIPAVLKGDELWCQLLSEPSGGSDLAGLITRATRKDGKWLLNGSKVWTTGGHACDMGICLARTDPTVPKHAGLTMFVVDMHAPGVTITPLKLIDGGTDFCQEFFDDVVLTDDDVVGEVNGGWTVATTHLANERHGMGRGWHIGLRRAVAAQQLEVSTSLIETVRSLGLAKDAHARQLVGEAIVINAVETLTTRRVHGGLRTGALPGPASALASLTGSHAGARRSALMSELAGPTGVAATPGNGPAESASLFGGGAGQWGLSRVMSHSIGGGTAEMQRNAIAERLLGLPREASFDRDLPFNQVLQNVAAARRAE
jgi:alkylation response protein AidB-like acyl-CoA dehydrogenase